MPRSSTRRNQQVETGAVERLSAEAAEDRADDPVSLTDLLYPAEPVRGVVLSEDVPDMLGLDRPVSDRDRRDHVRLRAARAGTVPATCRAGERRHVRGGVFEVRVVPVKRVGVRGLHRLHVAAAGEPGVPAVQVQAGGVVA